MKNFYTPEDRIKIEKLNEISDLRHRSTPYDVSKSDDLMEMFKMKVCALLDYIEYDDLLGNLLERFDESIEYYDTRTWLSFTTDVEKPDALLIKCYKSIRKAHDDLNNLVEKASNEFKKVFKLVFDSEAEMQEVIIGFEIQSNLNFEKIVDDILDNIYEVKNSHNMEEAYNNFLSFLRIIFLIDI
jgi:hypothetical protein